MKIERPQVTNINIENLHDFHRILASYLFTDHNECIKFIEQLIKSYEVYQMITDNYQLKNQIRELKDIINKE